MEIVLHRQGRDGWDVAGFGAAAARLLHADPVTHTLGLTTLDRLEVPALLATVRRRGALVGAVLREAGRPVLVSALPAGLAAHVVAATADGDPEPAGVNGPVGEAEAYAAAHTARTGDGVEVVRRMRLFRRVTLTRPTTVPGMCRVAGDGDVELLARWQSAFHDETIRVGPAGGDPRPGLREAIGRGAGFVLWERDGEPLAYAAARRPLAGMSRIGPVYTPPEQRGHGYGTAVTAAASAWAQKAGAREVCLFTDLANPVSNAIYPRIGYRPVHDALELAFRKG